MLNPTIIKENEAEAGAVWEERAEMLPRSFAELSPHTTPPAGSNGMEFVFGHWPSDETDEEVKAIIETIE